MFVVGVYPQGEKQTYKITTMDDGVTFATEEHLWQSRFTNTNRKRVIHTTLEIYEHLLKNKHRKQNSNVLLPLTKPIKGVKQKLEIDPYLLGLILGDGYIGRRAIKFSTKDFELLDAFRAKGYIVNYLGGCDYRVGLGHSNKRDTGGRFVAKEQSLFKNIEKMGLSGKKSFDKFIPQKYINGNLEQRLAIVQGLMDTDGTVDTRGHQEFSTNSLVMVKQVQRIVWSLGGKATISRRRVKGTTSYRLYIRTPNEIKLFRLPRKLKRLKPYNGGISQLGRRIKKIEKTGIEKTVCIKVSSRHGLYITDDYIVTHNTDAGMVWLTYDVKNPRFRGLVIRRNADDLSDWVDRARRMYHRFGADFAYRPTEIKFPTGAIIKTGHLKDDSSYTKYQGHEYQRMVIEELNQIPSEKRYLQLISSCRSTVPNLKPQVFCTTNPGGAGHGWVKRRFVDVCPPNTRYTDPDSGLTRIYIPATIDDNPTLLENDPNYIKILDSLKETDIELWKAWRLGSWDTFAGQFFREFRRDLHTCKPFSPSPSLPKYAGVDWGRVAPFVFLAGLFDVVKMDDGRVFHRVWIYREIDGVEKNPKEWADLIHRAVNVNEFSRISADPAMFTKGLDNSVSIADQFKKEGITMKPASNDRIGGWSVVHNWLSIAPDGLPYLIITEDCHDLITTLPELVHDENRVEDLDTTQVDHWCFCRHTPILTKEGYKNIINVTNKDFVWTPIGWSKVIKQQLTGEANVVDFRSTKVTKNHPFLTQDGFLQLKDLKMEDKLWSVFIFRDVLTGGIRIRQNFPMSAILSVVHRILLARRATYTEMYGSTLKVQFQRKWRFITETMFVVIILLKILKWSLVPHILKNIFLPFERLLKRGVLLPKKKLENGTKAQKAKHGILDTERKHGLIGKKLLKVVNFVMGNLIPKTLKKDFVVSITKCQCTGKQKVYNLVTDTGMYTAGTALVSNCDALRYLLKHVKWIDAKAGSVHQKEPLKIKRSMITKVDFDSFGRIRRSKRRYRPV